MNDFDEEAFNIAVDELIEEQEMFNIAEDLENLYGNGSQ